MSVRPRVIVAMGATAVRGILGRAATVTSLRGEAIAIENGSALVVTVHPSYLLRIRDEEDRRRETLAFERDLKRAQALATNSVD